MTTRRAVIVGLLIAQAASLLALFFVSGRLAATAESDHQNALLSTESAEAIDRMRAQIQPAETVVQFASNALADPSVSADSLLVPFREAMETSSQLDGIFVGSPDGSFVYLSRQETGYNLKRIEVTNGLRDTVNITLDNDGNELERASDPADTYNPVERPWYQLASANPGDVSWTDPYVFFTSRQLGITSAGPIVRDGQIQGVVGVDIELGSLSRFLDSLDTGTGGGAIIVNEDGVVIAHPEPELIQNEEGDSISTVAISDLDDQLARAAVASFVEEGGSEDTQLTSFDSESFGESRGSFRTADVGEGEWTVAVFGPADSLVSSLASARAAERTLLAIAGLTGLILVGVLTYGATKPLDALEKHAWSDSLTDLPNRRSILREIDELSESEATGSIAMLDIDRFKLVNDTYGHQAGDEVLIEVSRRAQEALANRATIGRIGGEEFVIVMASLGTAAAQTIAEDVRQAVKATPIQHSTGAIEVTVSLGLATSTGPTSRGHLMSVADAALLEAKSTGRDKVVSGSGPRIVNLDAG